MANKSYKFRIYPDTQQAELIQKTFGCVRFVWNYYLFQRMETYRESGKSPTRFQQDKSLSALKQELPWLREPDKNSLQNALKNLDSAYQNYFRRIKNGEKSDFLNSKARRTIVMRTRPPTTMAKTSAQTATRCACQNLAGLNAEYRKRLKAVSYQLLSVRTPVVSISCLSAVPM